MCFLINTFYSKSYYSSKDYHNFKGYSEMSATPVM